MPGPAARRIAVHKIDCDFVSGYLSLAVNAKKARELAHYTNELERRYGYRMRPVDQADIGTWIASERFHSGVFDPQSGHLHPLKYCLGLAAAARDSGAQLFENSPVVRVARGAKPLVATAHGEVACDFVVMAGNVYLNETGRRWRRKSTRASCRSGPTSSPPRPWTQIAPPP